MLEKLPKLFAKGSRLGDLMSTALTCWPLSTSCGELPVFFLPFWPMPVDSNLADVDLKQRAAGDRLFCDQV